MCVYIYIYIYDHTTSILKLRGEHVGEDEGAPDPGDGVPR